MIKEGYITKFLQSENESIRVYIIYNNFANYNSYLLQKLKKLKRWIKKKEKIFQIWIFKH